jgi:murein DD-endopeptidase MepM/ murein hydrolase activator NlpD
LSRILLVASNVVTAALTALVTTMFWVGAYGSNAGDPEPPRRQAALVATPTPPVPDRGGRLWLGPTGVAIPVLGVEPNQLLDTYSQARSDQRVHDAIDIMAPAGTPVVAAAPGTVEKLYFSQGGGGITAYVRSRDGRWSYYYAHLQDYAPGLSEGQLLKRGERIGDVGSTGNASPEGPHLHFAIHRMEPGDQWYQGTPINPYPLLAGNEAHR